MGKGKGEARGAESPEGERAVDRAGESAGNRIEDRRGPASVSGRPSFDAT